MSEELVRNRLPPGHFLSCLEGDSDIVQEILLGVISLVSGTHVGVQEFHCGGLLRGHAQPVCVSGASSCDEEGQRH